MGPAVQGKAKINVLSGSFGGVQGVQPRHIQATLLDIALPAGERIALDTKPDETVFVFLLEGDAEIAGQTVFAKSAVLFTPGDAIAVTAKPGKELRFMFFSGQPLHESVAWGGPIVMNTRAELELAFSELRAGTFIKHSR